MTAPNIVFVLIDDQSPNMNDYAFEHLSLKSDGVNFTNHIISTPICSPSRAAIMTGKHGHNTGVLGNDYPNGGYGVFGPIEATGWQTAMQTAGYYTAFMGKYQNHYLPEGNADPSRGFIYGADHVPSGWDEWFGVDEGGYKEWLWTATSKIGAGAATRIDKSTGHDPADYMTTYLQGRATAAIVRGVASGKPFIIEISPFSTHSGGAGTDPQHLQFPPADIDRKVAPGAPGSWSAPTYTNGDCGPGGATSCASIPWPDPAGNPNWNTPVENGLAWHGSPLDDATLDKNHEKHLNRVRMQRSVDRMITAIRAQLVSSGVDGNTWIIVMSDNGYHLGERCMSGGKGSTFDEDSRLLLIARPPGGTTGRDEPAVVQNVDLYNTFLDIAGVAQDTTRDGRSWKGFVTGSPPSPWRQTALIQFNTDGPTFDDQQGTGNPPSSRAIRDVNYLFTDYSDDFTAGDAPVTSRGELYRMTSGGPVSADPWQTVNQYPYLTQDSRDAIAAMAFAYRTSSGAALWTIGLDPIPDLEFGSAIIDESEEVHLTLDGPEFHEPGGRYELQWASGYAQMPSKDVPVTAIPGIRGVDPSGKATPRESYWTAMLRVYDRNESGVHGGPLVLEENMQDVYLQLGAREVITVGYARGGPVRWTFNGRVPGDVTPREVPEADPTHPIVDLPIMFQIPQGARRGLNFLEWSRPLTVDLNNEIIDNIQNTTAEIVDSLVRYRGEFMAIDLSDVISNGSGFRFTHPGNLPELGGTPDSRPILATEVVIIDTKTRDAWIGTIDPDQPLPWDTTDMTNISGGLSSFGPGRHLFPVTPKAGGGGPGAGPDPRNRIAKIDCVVTYSGDRSSTEIALRFKEARP